MCFSDTHLFRKAYIDIAGRIPTYEEVKNAPKTHPQLVKNLLESPDYNNNLYNIWADWLRLSDRRDNASMEVYKLWIKASISSNKPYNEMVKELLRAEGSVGENGAVGFYVRDRNNPLDHAAAIAETFLGEDIICAQCHDHPFKDFTQLEFYEIAAYTYSSQVKNGYGNKNQARKLVKDEPMLSKIINDMFRNVDFYVEESERKLKLPHDYQYTNAAPKEVIGAGRIFGNKPPEESTKNGELYANWITSRKNKMFAVNVVSRLWERSMSREATDAELLKWANIMVSSGYDFKKYLFTFFTSPEYMSSREPMRMTAEQIWDSLLFAYDNNYEFSTVHKDPALEKYSQFLRNAEPAALTNLAVKVEAKYERPRLPHFVEEVTGEKWEQRKTKRGFWIASSEIQSPAPDAHFLRQFGQSNRVVLDNSTKEATVQQSLTLMNGPLVRELLSKKSNLITHIEKQKDKDVLFMSFWSRKPTPQESRALSGFDNKEVLWVMLNSKQFLFY